MKTAEEIYEEEGGYDGNVDKESVCYMMKEYAKIEAIAFIEWATVGDWYRYSSTTPWRKDQIEATTEELYQLYQDSKNQVI